jgi:hypothetical protein
MSRSALPVILAVMLLAAGCGDSTTGLSSRSVAVSDADKVRAADVSILFVGNSHTAGHNLPELVCDMIRFLRPERTTYFHYVGVGHLDQTAQDPTCKTELETRPWKFVVLQAQNISMSGKYEYSRKEGLDLARVGKDRGATVVFYPEWGLRGKAGDGERQEKVYREMARDAGVGVAPVAKAWDLALAERPDLPLYESDGNHQSSTGAFLTACVLAGRLIGESPAELAEFRYEGAADEHRRFLAGIAAKALATEGAMGP